MESYHVIRFCFDTDSPDHRRIIETGLTREEAQAHCQREDTHGDGWFDGFDLENPNEEVLSKREQTDAALRHGIEMVTRLKLGRNK